MIAARMDEKRNRSKSGGLQGAAGCCVAGNINYTVQRYLLNQNSTAKGMVREQRQESQAEGQRGYQRLHCDSGVEYEGQKPT